MRTLNQPVELKVKIVPKLQPQKWPLWAAAELVGAAGKVLPAAFALLRRCTCEEGTSPLLPPRSRKRFAQRLAGRFAPRKSTNDHLEWKSVGSRGACGAKRGHIVGSLSQ